MECEFKIVSPCLWGLLPDPLPDPQVLWLSEMSGIEAVRTDDRYYLFLTQREITRMLLKVPPPMVNHSETPPPVTCPPTAPLPSPQ